MAAKDEQQGTFITPRECDQKQRDCVARGRSAARWTIGILLTIAIFVAAIFSTMISTSFTRINSNAEINAVQSTEIVAMKYQIEKIDIKIDKIYSAVMDIRAEQKGH
jgi:hypothetical protein